MYQQNHDNPTYNAWADRFQGSSLSLLPIDAAGLRNHYISVPFMSTGRCRRLVDGYGRLMVAGFDRFEGELAAFVAFRQLLNQANAQSEGDE